MSISAEVSVDIVPWGSCDYRQAVQLRRRVLREPLGLDFSEDELAAELNQFHFVAVRNGRVIGCLLLLPLDDGEVKMRQVATEPELQRSGVGKCLVAKAEEWATAHGYTLMTLHARGTVTGFYQKLGYVCEGEPFEEVTIPHQKMAKPLIRP